MYFVYISMENAVLLKGEKTFNTKGFILVQQNQVLMFLKQFRGPQLLDTM